MNAPSSYNVIIGRSTLNSLGVTLSTLYFVYEITTLRWAGGSHLERLGNHQEMLHRESETEEGSKSRRE